VNVDRREPTEDQLRDAWRALAQESWGDYDQVKQAALHWSRVQSRARLVASGVRVDAAPALVPVHHAAAPAPLSSPPWGSMRAPHGPMFDRKRAAAGEREDD
jgi:hypothetical protein